MRISRDATGAHNLAPILGHDPSLERTWIITDTRIWVSEMGAFDTIALKDLAIIHVSVSKNRGLWSLIMESNKQLIS